MLQVCVAGSVRCLHSSGSAISCITLLRKVCASQTNSDVARCKTWRQTSMPIARSCQTLFDASLPVWTMDQAKQVGTKRATEPSALFLCLRISCLRPSAPGNLHQTSAFSEATTCTHATVSPNPHVFIFHAIPRRYTIFFPYSRPLVFESGTRIGIDPSRPCRHSACGCFRIIHIRPQPSIQGNVTWFFISAPAPSYPAQP